MKAIRKNLLVIGIISVLISLPLTAASKNQQQGQEEQQNEYNQQVQSLERNELNPSHRVGGYLSYEPVLGALHQFVACSLGGGATYELGIPLLQIFEIGPIVHLTVNDNIVTDERLASMVNLKFDIGCFFRIEFGKTGFALSPELDYGILVYFPKVSEGYTNSTGISSAYVDQLIQIGLGLRYSHEKILNGNLEFDLTPTYSLSPEKHDLIHYLGFRLGALYKIGGTK